MNKKGVFGVGFAFLIVLFFIYLVTAGLIEPLKENLDNSRDGTGLNTGLNCPNTPNFNQADYQNDTDFEKLVRRPTCFVTGNYLVIFFFAIMIAGITWVGRNWRR